jgi:hypothetical protein
MECQISDATAIRRFAGFRILRLHFLERPSLESSVAATDSDPAYDPLLGNGDNLALAGHRPGAAWPQDQPVRRPFAVASCKARGIVRGLEA